jgi:CheY-like chemotaxis protein
MSQLRVLVVDDATFTRDLLKKMLRDHFPGAEIFDKENAKKAQLLMRTQDIDLILSDWEMPEMSGEEFLRWVREHPDFQDIPFIMVSSRGERDYVVQAVQAGVSDYLGKPFTPEDLVQKVKKVLKRAGKTELLGNLKVSAAQRGVAFGSVDALGAKNVNDPLEDTSNIPAAVPATAPGAALFSKPASAKAEQKPRSKTRSKGQAQLVFPAGHSLQCVIREISLQGLQGLIKREELLPGLFDQVVVSIVQHDGASVARLNGYLHSISAVENRIDCELIKLVIRFVDDDPEKLEHLSRFIAGK